MCSYGGHIIPRPHDKTLCYVGGETRIVVTERKLSLQDLMTRLSHTLLDGRRFGLKYQLPSEDLDSLISIATNEDLHNMIEEYDRIEANNNGSSLWSSRIRLFLFCAKPETAQTMGTLFNDSQSETWFVDALNGVQDLSRGFSDSVAVGDLLRLDTISDPKMQQHLPDPDCNAAQTKVVAHPQDVYTTQSVMSGSPMVETNTSSLDSSTTLSPSMAHLPLIPVRVDENYDEIVRLGEEMKGGETKFLEQHFSSQLIVTAPYITTTVAPPCSAAIVPNHATMIIQSNDSNITSANMSDEDSMSENGVPASSPSRKPPLPLTLQQRTNAGYNDFRNAASGGINFPSPDSVKSDSSIASGISLTKTVINQDQAPVTTSNENKPSIIQHNTEQKSDNQTTSFQNQNTQLQPPQDHNSYIYLPQHHEQQAQHQFMQENIHYIPTHPQVPPSYRTVYATPQHIYPYQVDHQQQYPMYFLPITQTQPYNNVAQQPLKMASLVPNSSTATHEQPPVYPSRSVSSASNPQIQQYPRYNTTGQPMTGHSVSYGHFDYGHNQVYYTGQLASPAPVAAAAAAAVPVAAASQYQSLTPAQAAMIAEASLQLPNTECSQQQPTS
ncbi:Protein B6 [Bienertia sinuspersici]